MRFTKGNLKDIWYYINNNQKSYKKIVPSTYFTDHEIKHCSKVLEGEPLCLIDTNSCLNAYFDWMTSELSGDIIHVLQQHNAEDKK